MLEDFRLELRAHYRDANTSSPAGIRLTYKYVWLTYDQSGGKSDGELDEDVNGDLNWTVVIWVAGCNTTTGSSYQSCSGHTGNIYLDPSSGINRAALVRSRFLSLRTSGHIRLDGAGVYDIASTD